MVDHEEYIKWKKPHSSSSSLSGNMEQGFYRCNYITAHILAPLLNMRHKWNWWRRTACMTVQKIYHVI